MNEKTNKFLCENYVTNDDNDITLGSFIAQSLVILCVVGIALVVLIGAITIVGILIHVCFNGGEWILVEDASSMIFLYGLITTVATIVICCVLSKIFSIKLAHCPVKENKKDEEEKQ